MRRCASGGQRAVGKMLGEEAVKYLDCSRCVPGGRK